MVSNKSPEFRGLNGLITIASANCMEQGSSLAQKDPAESETASAGDQFMFIVPQLPDFPAEVGGSYSRG